MIPSEGYSLNHITSMSSVVFRVTELSILKLLPSIKYSDLKSTSIRIVSSTDKI